ncbi:hypothetical protein [Halobaculum rarum]|uniref:hypothetical protein n=1 Tax=Halobaculum rarum TaxID=3075122 RepID=UPI0032AF2C31
MANKDSGWRPKGVAESYKGFEVWEYEIGPHGLNPGEVDGEVSLDIDGEDDADGEDDVERSD